MSISSHASHTSVPAYRINPPFSALIPRFGIASNSVRFDFTRLLTTYTIFRGSETSFFSSFNGDDFGAGTVGLYVTLAALDVRITETSTTDAGITFLVGLGVILMVPSWSRSCDFRREKTYDYTTSSEIRICSSYQQWRQSWKRRGYSSLMFLVCFFCFFDKVFYIIL